jgi:hypothetical protein
VLLLWGAAGDPIVSMIHLKQPAGEVGPWRLEHDHSTGTTSIFHDIDLLTVVGSRGTTGVTATEVAVLLFEIEKPSDSQRKKALRKLDRLVQSGLVERYEMARDVYSGGKPQAFFRLPNPNGHPNGQPLSGNGNAANGHPTDTPSDSRSNPNGQPTDTNGHAGPTDSVPPSIEGDAGGPGRNGTQNTTRKLRGKTLDCNGCGKPFAAEAIVKLKGYCATCHQERNR